MDGRSSVMHTRGALSLPELWAVIAGLKQLRRVVPVAVTIAAAIPATSGSQDDPQPVATRRRRRVGG